MTSSNDFSNMGPVIRNEKVGRDLNVHTTYNSTPIPERKPIDFRVEQPDQNFTGRLLERKELQDAISSTKKPHINVVSGMGGVGKTQLVRQFINENRNSYTNVIWINVGTIELMEEAFRTLASCFLKISTKDANERDKDLKSVVEQVFTELSIADTLIVYDNADELEHIKFLLTMKTAGITPHILITSRIQEWTNIKKISLKVWKPDEAFEFLSATLASSDDDVYKNLLAEKLQYFPLALRQATAYIIFQRELDNFSIGDYVKEYDKETQTMLNFPYFKYGHLSKYEKTTFTTWRITIAAIEKVDLIGKLAARILRTIAYFDRDNIRRDIFFYHQLNENADNMGKSEYERNVKLAIRCLITYSMIDSQTSSEGPQSIFSIHSLVQKVIKIEQECNHQDESTIRDGLLIFSALLDDTNSDDFQQHAVSVFDSALKFEELGREFRKMPAKILESLVDKVKYRLGVAFSEQILQHLTKLFSSDDPDLLLCKSQIAQSFIKHGMTEDALKLYLEIYDQEKKVHGKDHINHGISSFITAAYGIMGEYNKGLEFVQQEIKKEEAILGRDHKQTLSSKNNLAYIYLKLGKYNDALHIFQGVFEKLKEILEENDPVTLRTYLNVGYSYSHLGQHTDAIDIFQDVYEKLRDQKNLMDDHPDILYCQYRMVPSYSQLGQHEEALRIAEYVFEKRKKLLGVDHPDTLKSQHQVGHLYNKIGRTNDALLMLQEVFEKRKQTFGENHPDTLTSQHQIGYSYSQMGHHADAQRIFQEVFEKRKKALGEDHPRTLTSQYQIGYSLSKLGKHTDALQIVEYVFEKQKTILGENHPDTRSTKYFMDATNVQATDTTDQVTDTTDQVTDTTDRVIERTDQVTEATEADRNSATEPTKRRRESYRLKTKRFKAKTK